MSKETRRIVVAIDGPSGAGKGTVAKAVARALGYRHVDTGAMYRAVAWKAKYERLPLDDDGAVAGLAGRAAFDLDGPIRIDGHDVTLAIRTPEIDVAASTVAKLPGVRAVLVNRQRALGAEGGVVMEGRDIGTVVFPRAEVKLYLDASPEERARRRASDDSRRGGREGPVLSDVATALDARDRSDRTRQTSPLKTAADAAVIDTTGLSIEEVVARVMRIVEDALDRRS